VDKSGGWKGVSGKVGLVGWKGGRGWWIRG